jgi:ABC-type branched-subunit amino acid transport system substrate-binding protein
LNRIGGEKMRANKKIDSRRFLKESGTALIVAAVLFMGLGNAIAAPPDVKIGVSCPLSGVCAPTGKEMKDGALLAARHINEQGGILGGRKIVPIIYDDKISPDEAITVFRKMIYEDKVMACIGIYDANQTLAVKDMVADAGLLLCSNGMHWTIPAPGDKFIHEEARSESFCAVFFKWLMKNHPEIKTVVLMGPSMAWSTGYLGAAEFSWKKLGAPYKKLGENIYFPFGAADVTAPVSKAVSYKPDLIFTSTWDEVNIPKEGKALRELGFKGMWVPDLTLGVKQDITEAHPEIMEGTLALFRHIPGGVFDTKKIYKGFPEWLPDGKGCNNAHNRKMVKDFMDTYKYVPTTPVNQVYTEMMIVCKAIDKVGKDKPELDELLKAARNLDYVTLRGDKLSITDLGQVVDSSYYIVQAQKGKVVVKERIPHQLDYIASPTEYEPYLKTYK